MSGGNNSVMYEFGERFAGYIGQVLHQELVAPTASLSIASLLSALTIAILFTLMRRRRPFSGRRMKALFKVLFPKRWAFARSSKTDVLFFFLNAFVFGIIIGQAILSFAAISGGIKMLLTSAFGEPVPLGLPWYATASLFTIGLFLAYEFGYWLDHYLSHKIPFLWEFHKVHHSAEVLTPLTNSRVHPVDSLVFLNILGVVIGSTSGVLSYVLGQTVMQFTIAGSNAVLVVCLYLVTHLQHSHLWIAFTGKLGKLLLSPAHHQIHHSMNPIHYDRNFGATIAVWDWIFGTLHIPAKEREKLRFGVDGMGADGVADDPHSITGSLVTPFVRAFNGVLPGPVPDANSDGKTLAVR